MRRWEALPIGSAGGVPVTAPRGRGLGIGGAGNNRAASTVAASRFLNTLAARRE